MTTVFITGTDTGCGKTHIACAVLRALAMNGRSAVGYKPVASGCERTADGLRNDDALRLQAASGIDVEYSRINPVALEPAIAPHIAAAEAGLSIDFQALRAGQAYLAGLADWVVVEGAGGYLVPLGDEGSFADLAAGWPVILVVGMKLGCINHALLSAEAIARRAPLLGWIGNVLPPGQDYLEDNIRSLRTLMPARCLGVVGPNADVAEAAAELDLAAIQTACESLVFAPTGKPG